MAAVRDSKGHLLPGHPRLNILPGHVGGHPRTIKRQVKDALSLAEEAMPAIIAAMIKRATGESDCPLAVQQAAAEYLVDRIYGRPSQAITGAEGGALELRATISLVEVAHAAADPGGAFKERVPVALPQEEKLALQLDKGTKI